MHQYTIIKNNAIVSSCLGAKLHFANSRRRSRYFWKLFLPPAFLPIFIFSILKFFIAKSLLRFVSRFLYTNLHLNIYFFIFSPPNKKTKRFQISWNHYYFHQSIRYCAEELLCIQELPKKRLPPKRKTNKIVVLNSSENATLFVSQSLSLFTFAR